MNNSVENLLKGIIIASGNDACVALAFDVDFFFAITS